MADWIVPIGNAAETLGLTINSRVSEQYVGPCPNCGGTDRFRLFIRTNGQIGDTCNHHCDARERLESLILTGVIKDIRRRPIA